MKMVINPVEVPLERHKRLRYFRNLKGWGAATLGKKVEPPIPESTLRDWERGVIPKRDDWAQLDKILEVPNEYSLTREKFQEPSGYEVLSELETKVERLRETVETEIAGIQAQIKKVKAQILESECKTNGDFRLPHTISRPKQGLDFEDSVNYIKTCLYSACEVLETVREESSAARDMFRKMVNGRGVGYLGAFFNAFFNSEEQFKRWHAGLSIDEIKYNFIGQLGSKERANIGEAANYVRVCLYNAGYVLEQFKEVLPSQREEIREQFNKVDTTYLTSFIGNFFGGEGPFNRWKEKHAQTKINYQAMKLEE